MKIKTTTELFQLIDSWGIDRNSYKIRGRSNRIVIYPSDCAKSKGATPENFSLINSNVDIELLQSILKEWDRLHKELPF